MRVVEVFYCNSKVAMVYITTEEQLSKTIKEKIIKLKKEYEYITIFVGGKDSMKKALTKIIESRR